ncbi:hypothetical protein [Microbacterium sp. 11MF]|uniref:hypothetical protein n=1 Tax=Microbacterium sp. 11MF TaxID=1169146 RepID=UPI00037359D6|nr:hypothetical protein [Microbacterium sp. 11MF]
MSSQSKLREAKHFAELFPQQHDEDGIRRVFGAAVAAIRTAAQAMREESLARVSGERDASRTKRDLREWWDAEHRRQMDDDVLRWILDARNSDQHGDNANYLQVYYRYEADLVCSTVPPGAEVADGQIIYDRHTPDERREPLNGIHSKKFFSRAVGKVETHRGDDIRDHNGPHALLFMAIEYYKELWYATQDDPLTSDWPRPL